MFEQTYFYKKAGDVVEKLFRPLYFLRSLFEKKSQL